MKSILKFIVLFMDYLPHILILTILSLLIFCGSGCSEEESLQRICVDKDIPCIIRDDKIIKGNLKPIGECNVGYTSCEGEDMHTVCLDYIGPNKEICDGLDNDCDGFVDEDYNLDKDGFATCFGDCADWDNLIYPGAPERCNRIDDDCDGEKDENLVRVCWNGPSDAIFNDASTCELGVSTCSYGRWGSCMDQIKPQDELCDGLDNDCDGEIDEMVFGNCGPRTDTGLCKFGNQICTDNGETYCIGAVYPQDEACDNLDNDCNGIIDDGLEKPCETDCGVGIEICNAGQWVSCSAPIPQEELCDGLDNDCNGTVDDGCGCQHGEARSCRGGILIDPVDNSTITCGVGAQLCENGEWGSCYALGIDSEQCNNWDDDCDGNIDGFTSPCGDPNTAGQGVCQLGTSTCTAGRWEQCEGEIVPTEEICDQLDNDCDGLVDEELNPYNKVDIIFAIDGSGSMCNVMSALRQGIANYVVDFQGTEHRFGIVAFPGVGIPSHIYDIVTSPPLTDITSFLNILNSVQCTRGGHEPSYDTLYEITSYGDPAGIGWRQDAYPYIILFTDEEAQTWANVTETMIALNTISCGIGSCSPGDKIEVYIVTELVFYTQWNEIVFSEPERVIDIYPAEESRYTEFLRNIFMNVCI